MYPRWIYLFCHWLWVASLVAMALLAVFTFAILLPFNEFFSDEFVIWLADDFIGWAIAGIMASFSVGTGVCVQYVSEEIHKQRIENEKKEREQEYGK